MPFRSIFRRSQVGDRNSHTSLPVFEYQALTGADEIRVLEVSHANANTITCSLRHINITDAINYVAISYMWGSSQKTDTIVIDGCSLPISPTQKHMIFDLCVQNQMRYLWIDAVCINQVNLLERNHQVGLMREIYSRANYVIAYVRGNDHSSYRSAYLSGTKRSSLSLESTLTGIRHAVTTGRITASTVEQNCSRFIDNDYFVRRWIIQEICLARSVIIRCDGYELPMELLRQFFDMHRGHENFTQSRAAKICTLVRNIPNHRAKLEDLLYSHEAAICRERLDRVYALLSLSEIAGRHIPVDYHIHPLKLLLSIVYMASRYEDLKKSRTFSFACFLRQYLEITTEEFRYGIDNPHLVDVEERDYMFSSSVSVLGTLTTTRIDPIVEDRLNMLRRILPTIRHFKPIRLKRIRSRREAYKLSQDARFEDDTIGLPIDAVNLWVFSSELPPLYASSDNARRVLAGMSTSSIREGDEVWQFPRTPVALIARPNAGDYILVARALLIKTKVWKNKDINRVLSKDKYQKLDNMLEVITDHAAGSLDKRNISMSTSDLLRLMNWVSIFAER